MIQPYPYYVCGYSLPLHLKNYMPYTTTELKKALKGEVQLYNTQDDMACIKKTSYPYSLLMYFLNTCPPGVASGTRGSAEGTGKVSR